MSLGIATVILTLVCVSLFFFMKTETLKYLTMLLGGYGLGLITMVVPLHIIPDVWSSPPDPYVQRGRDDYRQGIYRTDCPFTETTAFLKWYEGWEEQHSQDVLARKTPVSISGAVELARKQVAEGAGK